MDNLIPTPFYNAYGKSRDFQLEGMLKALVFYNLLDLPTIPTLVFIIIISSDFRKFLGFQRSPHPSQFYRFNSLFYGQILQTFHHLVDLTYDFAIDGDETLDHILITDTTEFELYLKENNPKSYQAMLKTVKTYAKSRKSSQLFTQEGVPTCPNNLDLPMIFPGIINSKNRADLAQYVCPKRTIKITNHTKSVSLDCKNPFIFLCCYLFKILVDDLSSILFGLDNITK